MIPRPFYKTATRFFGMLAIVKNLYAIHENVIYTGGILMRILECGMILDSIWVKQYDVCKVSFPQVAAIRQS